MDSEAIRDKLISYHTSLIEQLEVKYMTHIQQLLVQKCKLVIKMNKMFYKKLSECNTTQKSTTTINGTQRDDDDDDDILSSISSQESVVYHSTQRHKHYEEDNTATEKQNAQQTQHSEEPKQRKCTKKIECDHDGCNCTQRDDDDDILSSISVDNTATEQQGNAQQNQHIEHDDDYVELSSISSQETETGSVVYHSIKKRYVEEQDFPTKHKDYEENSEEPNYCDEINVKNPKHRRKCTKNKKYFICHYTTCRKKYSTKHHLKEHIRIHTGIGLFKCDHDGCSTKFTTKSQLKSHKRFHSDIRPFKCDHNDCNKAFKQRSDLERHKLIHSDIKPFKCNYDGCNQAFRQRSNLQKHMRTHTGEKPHECTFCKKRFTQTSTRNRHIINVHSTLILNNDRDRD